MPSGESINSPKSPDEKSHTLAAAALAPPKFAAIYEHYKNNKFPEGEFLANTIVRQFDIPVEHANKCAEVFAANMKFVGLLRDTPGGTWLAARPAQGAISTAVLAPVPDPEPSSENLMSIAPPDHTDKVGSAGPDTTKSDLSVNTRVFITHGTNMKIVDQVKELLTYGKFEPVIAVERHSVSKPVPDKVLDEMRGCAAAVIHVGAERKLFDGDGESQAIINSNVLIEIGAAMALYGRNFILLVERGTELPSNLQGLYEVRYEGDGLDHEATMSLLKSFNEFHG
jgi:predicted nucleotide-binding protein